MKLTPLGNRVIVKVEEAAKETKGGIILPDTAQEKPKRGTVVAAGPGKHEGLGSGDPVMHVKAGDVVLFAKYAGSEVEIDGEKLLIVDQDEILAKIE